MSNDVDSKLLLTGDQQEIACFLDACKVEYGLNFSRPFPCPEELSNVRSPVQIVSEADYKAALGGRGTGLPLTAELSAYYRAIYGADNWFDWCYGNWGTKWPPYDILEVPGEDNAFYFCTAWEPAHGLWRQLSRLFPGITFHIDYRDEQECFWGTATFEAGEMTEDLCFPHGDADDL